MTNRRKAGMTRTEKIALLTKVFTGGSGVERRLEEAAATMPRSLILIDDFDFPPGLMVTDTDPVTFFDKGQQHRMSLAEATAYARRLRIGTLVVIPHNHRINEPA